MILLPRQYSVKTGFCNKLTSHSLRPFIQVAENTLTSTTIVFTRYIILEWIHRNQNDQKTYGKLFFMFCDDIHDMDLASTLQSLMALFVEHVLTLSADITSIIKCKVSEWIASKATFIHNVINFSKKQKS